MVAHSVTSGTNGHVQVRPIANHRYLLDESISSPREPENLRDVIVINGGVRYEK